MHEPSLSVARARAGVGAVIHGHLCGGVGWGRGAVCRIGGAQGVDGVLRRWVCVSSPRVHPRCASTHERMSSKPLRRLHHANRRSSVSGHLAARRVKLRRCWCGQDECTAPQEYFQRTTDEATVMSWDAVLRSAPGSNPLAPVRELKVMCAESKPMYVFMGHFARDAFRLLGHPPKRKLLPGSMPFPLSTMTTAEVRVFDNQLRFSPPTPALPNRGSATHATARLCLCQLGDKCMDAMDANCVSLPSDDATAEAMLKHLNPLMRPGEIQDALAQRANQNARIKKQHFRREDIDELTGRLKKGAMPSPKLLSWDEETLPAAPPSRTDVLQARGDVRAQLGDHHAPDSPTVMSLAQGLAESRAATDAAETAQEDTVEQLRRQLAEAQEAVEGVRRELERERSVRSDSAQLLQDMEKRVSEGFNLLEAIRGDPVLCWGTYIFPRHSPAIRPASGLHIFQHIVTAFSCLCFLSASHEWLQQHFPPLIIHIDL